MAPRRQGGNVALGLARQPERFGVWTKYLLPTRATSRAIRV